MWPCRPRLHFNNSLTKWWWPRNYNQQNVLDVINNIGLKWHIRLRGPCLFDPASRIWWPCDLGHKRSPTNISVVLIPTCFICRRPDHRIHLLEYICPLTWWRHGMETLPAFLSLCEGNHRSPMDSHHKGSVMPLIDVFYAASPKNRLKKQSQITCDLRRRDAHVTFLLCLAPPAWNADANVGMFLECGTLSHVAGNWHYEIMSASIHRFMVSIMAWLSSRS